MAKRRDALTGDLFAAIPQPMSPDPGAFDFRTQVTVITGELLADARAMDPELDRYEVAARVSRLVGKEVSKAMLDAYTAESRESHNVPAWLMPALELVCQSSRYTNWLAGVRGGRFLLGPAALDAEIGRRMADMERDRERLKQLQDFRRRVG